MPRAARQLRNPLDFWLAQHFVLAPEHASGVLRASGTKFLGTGNKRFPRSQKRPRRFCGTPDVHRNPEDFWELRNRRFLAPNASGVVDPKSLAGSCGGQVPRRAAVATAAEPAHNPSGEKRNLLLTLPCPLIYSFSGNACIWRLPMAVEARLRTKKTSIRGRKDRSRGSGTKSVVSASAK